MTTTVSMRPLLAAAEALAPLDVPGCRQLSRDLNRICYPPDASQPDLAAILPSAVTVQRVLRAETDPNRWQDEFPDAEPDMISALTTARAAQADLVQDAIGTIRAIMTGQPHEERNLVPA